MMKWGQFALRFGLLRAVALVMTEFYPPPSPLRKGGGNLNESPFAREGEILDLFGLPRLTSKSRNDDLPRND